MFIPPHHLLNKAATWVRVRKDAFQYLRDMDPALQFAEAPSITIARDPGSGGRPIAEEVARRLKFTYYDESIIDSIAKSTKKRREVIARVDEKTRTYMEDLVQSLINPDYISDTTYFQHLVQSVLSVGHVGKAVILGRGANFILRSPEKLDVYITAPRATRVARAVKFENVTEEKAKEIIEKVSKERKEFVSQYFRKDGTRPGNYDLVINTEHFTIEQSAELIIAAFRKKFPRWHEKFITAFRTSRLSDRHTSEVM